MRIAIIGAPGSGKNKLMDALEEEAAKKDSVLEGHTFVRTPIGDLAEQGRGLGAGATYNEHILLYALQQRALDMLEDKTKVVQSGTVLQRLAHMAAKHDEIILGDASQIDANEVMFRIRPAIEILTLLTVDAFQSDLTFLLMRDMPKDILILDYDDKVQFHLIDALESMSIPHRNLPDEVEDQVREIMEVVSEAVGANSQDS